MDTSATGSGPLLQRLLPDFVGAGRSLFAPETASGRQRDYPGHQLKTHALEGFSKAYGQEKALVWI